MKKLLFLILFALIFGLASSDIFDNDWRIICSVKNYADKCVEQLKLLLSKYHIYDLILILLKNGETEAAQKLCETKLRNEKVCKEILYFLFRYIKYIG